MELAVHDHAAAEERLTQLQEADRRVEATTEQQPTQLQKAGVEADGKDEQQLTQLREGSRGRGGGLVAAPAPATVPVAVPGAVPGAEPAVTHAHAHAPFVAPCALWSSGLLLGSRQTARRPQVWQVTLIN